MSFNKELKIFFWFRLKKNGWRNVRKLERQLPVYYLESKKKKKQLNTGGKLTERHTTLVQTI